MVRERNRVAVAILAATLSIAVVGAPVIAAEAATQPVLTAYLDGRPIPLADVSKYFCDDFDYPVIRCSSLALVAELRATTVLLVTAIDYVTIYDATNFAGSYMHVSQNYSTLMSIGWNDEISSFRGRNSETGTFWTDWFETGSFWAFCCNTQYSSLGSYNNTFSSVERT